MSTDKIRGVYVEPGKPAREIVIDNALTELVRLVDGAITTAYPWGTSIVLFANDEGMLNGMTPNRLVDWMSNTIIYGPFFICGQLADDIVSLPESKMKWFLDMFSEPEVFEEVVYIGKPSYKWHKGERYRRIPDPRASLDFIGFWGL